MNRPAPGTAEWAGGMLATMTEKVRRVMAHRGASAQEQANTIPAFQLAATLGSDFIELDVRVTADHALVVNHDAVVTTGQAICDLNEAELPGWMPSLRAAIAACGQSIINVEIKNNPADPDYDPERRMVEPIAAEIMSYCSAEQILMSSFDSGVLARLAEVAPDLRRAQLVRSSGYHTGDLKRIAELGAVAVHPGDSLVDEAFILEAHFMDLAVHVWTVDDPTRQMELYEMGADGICTKDPGSLLRLLGRR